MSVVLVLGALCCAALAQGVVVVSKRSHASAVADAAALAAATALSQGLGRSGATDAAAVIARLNGAELERCVCDGLEATVVISEAVRVVGVSVVYARARAVVEFSSA